ncbi:hypothetical protein [Glycomyces paridis]|uniref:Uncharacterized protein n=1 Tax=Glycomyces paridis TaxID=2126555 RepID=A0A4S8PNG5_9ACTN|nr:hypothetical protein [Glycomyces paridis]THV30159.1 hypothetical protein E9998_07240 [Glycomyces paridis]
MSYPDPQRPHESAPQPPPSHQPPAYSGPVLDPNVNKRFERRIKWIIAGGFVVVVGGPLLIWLLSR